MDPLALSGCQTALPQLYVLDDRGRMLLGPPSRGIDLPAALRALVSMYFATAATNREAWSDVLEIDGDQLAVRIVAADTLGEPGFAVLVQPLAARLRRDPDIDQP